MFHLKSVRAACSAAPCTSASETSDLTIHSGSDMVPTSSPVCVWALMTPKAVCWVGYSALFTHLSALLHFSCIMIEFCRRPDDGPDEPTWKDTRRYEVVSLTLLFNMDYIFKRKSGEEADSKCVTLTETRCFNFDRWSQFRHTDKPHRQTDSILTAFENSHAVLTLTHFTFDFSLHCGEIGGEPANSQSQKRTHHWSDVCWNLPGFCSTPCLTTGAGVVWTRLN